MLYSEMSSRLEFKICRVVLEQGEIYSLIRHPLLEWIVSILS